MSTLASSLAGLRAADPSHALSELIKRTELSWYNQSDPVEELETRKTVNSLYLLELLGEPDPQCAFAEWVAMQGAAVRLELAPFMRLRGRIARVPKEMLAALLLVHDLGKSGRVAAFFRKALPGQTVPAGHDELFSALLQAAPGYFPTLASLGSYRHLILEVVKAHFNLPQFMQAECPAAVIAPIRGLSSDAYDLMVAEAVLDLAGAAGCAPGSGSVVYSRPTAEATEMALAALDGLRDGASGVTETYENYLRRRAALIGLTGPRTGPLDPVLFTLTRLACCLRWTTAERGPELMAAYTALTSRWPGQPGEPPSGAAYRLVSELNADGIIRRAILVEYLPMLLQNVYRREGGGGPAAVVVLDVAARIFDEASVELTRHGFVAGTVKVVIDEVARLAAHVSLSDVEFALVGKAAEDLRIVPKDRRGRGIPAAEFRDSGGIEQFGLGAGQRIGIITAGGGADVINAALAGTMLARRGVRIEFIASVRNARPSSQAADGSQPSCIRLAAHGGQLTERVFRVTASSTPAPESKFRFLEWLPALDVFGGQAVYLVIEDAGHLADDLGAVLSHHAVDVVAVFDTGGDILESAGRGLRSSLSQDHRVLGAASAAVRQATLVVAIANIGMDSPPDARQKLEGCKAALFLPDKDDEKLFLNLLDRCEVAKEQRDGCRFLGKSPRLWAKALGGASGFCDAGVPHRLMGDPRNPWKTFYYVDGPCSGEGCAEDGRGGGRGIFVVPAERLIARLVAEGG
ncbi:MAG: DUF1152 domain-containing protein [Planctomycetaceae bacterium]|nr:DUF1152 domain-containing protein [Planctomycetaceae bacterium]